MSTDVNSESSHNDTGARGRDATRPADVPRSGWKDILWRVWKELGRDHVSLVAAGLALYALLATFPALIAVLSVYGLVASPADALAQTDWVFELMPPDAASILREQLAALTASRETALGFGALAAVLVSVWSARKGMAALITATNIAYDEPERRGLLHRVLLSIGFTLGAIVAFFGMCLFAVVVPIGLEAGDLVQPWSTLALACRWAVLWALMVLGLAVVYRWGPNRENARWRWVTWGSVIAATLWLIGSVLFSLYVREFGDYGRTYGALGGVIVLLLWFFLSGYVIVLGAEINAELEHQTARDTTEGPPEPMGQRGAHVADTLGRARPDSDAGA